MTFPKARLAVSACLLIAWISYLGYLVYETRAMVVLSKPQFMVAQAYVVVQVQGEGRDSAWPALDVTIEKVLWSKDAAGPRLAAGQILHLASLAEKNNGYRGVGSYLAPLLRSGTEYRIAPLPQRGIRIYPLTPETEAQLQPFLDAKKK